MSGKPVQSSLSSALRPFQAYRIDATWWERRHPPQGPLGRLVRCRVGESTLRKAMGIYTLRQGCFSSLEVCSLSCRKENEGLVLVRKTSEGPGAKGLNSGTVLAKS